MRADGACTQAKKSAHARDKRIETVFAPLDGYSPSRVVLGTYLRPYSWYRTAHTTANKAVARGREGATGRVPTLRIFKMSNGLRSPLFYANPPASPCPPSLSMRAAATNPSLTCTSTRLETHKITPAPPPMAAAQSIRPLCLSTRPSSPRRVHEPHAPSAPTHHPRARTRATHIRAATPLH